jgi:hypothetical protein
LLLKKLAETAASLADARRALAWTRVFRLRFRIARRGAAMFAGERAPVATW